MKMDLKFIAIVCLAAMPSLGIADEREWKGVRLEITMEEKHHAVACSLGLAHWYEEMTGAASFGSPVKVSLLALPPTGEVSVLNVRGEKMRLQEIRCGRTDVSRVYWKALPIERLRAGPQFAAIACEGAQPGCRWSN